MLQSLCESNKRPFILFYKVCEQEIGCFVLRSVYTERYMYHFNFFSLQLNEVDFKGILALDDEVFDGDNGHDDDHNDDKNQENGEEQERLKSPSSKFGDPLQGKEDKDDKDMEIT